MVWLAVAGGTPRPVNARGTIEYGIGDEPSVAMAGWRWDGVELVATADVWGCAPLLWWADRTRIVVADRLDELLKALPADVVVSVDTEALATTMQLGQPLGIASPAGNVRFLPACATLRWRAGEEPALTTPAAATPPATGLSRGALIDAYIDAFRVAVSRRLPQDGPVLVPLSGGADSRHIVAELCRQGVAIDAVVTAATHRADPELLVAAEVARRLGLRHQVIPLGWPTLADESRSNAATSWCASELAWYLPVVDFLAEQEATSYDGIGGDVLSAGLYQTDERARLVRDDDWIGLASSLLGSPRTRQRRQAWVPATLAGDLPSEDETLRQVARYWQTWREEPNPLAWAMFQARTRRHIAMVPFALMRGQRVMTPYLDEDVVGLLRSVALHHTVDHRLHIDALDRAFPALRDVGYADGNAGRTADVRAGLRRRAIAARLTVSARTMWSGGGVGDWLARAASLPAAGFKSFKEVRRAFAIYEAWQAVTNAAAPTAPETRDAAWPAR